MRNHPLKDTATKLFVRIDPRKWGTAAVFTGNSYGPFYTTGGRGGLAIRQQFNVLQGGVIPAVRLPVNSLTVGQTSAGSYNSQSLALTGRNNQ